MIDLLPLLEVYNTYGHNDITFDIAKDILGQYNSLKLGSQVEFAESLHISVSSLDRFLKRMVYQSFGEYRMEHRRKEEYYCFDHLHAGTHPACGGGLAGYAGAFLGAVEQMLGTVEEHAVERLVESLLEAERVIFVCAAMPSEVWYLQMDLVLLGKTTSAFLNPEHQIEDILAAPAGTLVVVLDAIRQEGGFLEDAVETAKRQGVGLAAISAVFKPSLARCAQPYVSFRGERTRADHFTLMLLLSYVGEKLRERYLYGEA